MNPLKVVHRSQESADWALNGPALEKRLTSANSLFCYACRMAFGTWLLAQKVMDDFSHVLLPGSQRCKWTRSVSEMGHPCTVFSTTSSQLTHQSFRWYMVFGEVTCRAGQRQAEIQISLQRCRTQHRCEMQAYYCNSFSCALLLGS